MVQQEYIADLRATIEAETAQLDMGAVFGQVSDPANLWAFFNACTDTVATAATNSVVARWASRLGGADIYTKLNVLALAEALRIDYGTLG